MNYFSVCDGIGAAHAALLPLDWRENFTRRGGRPMNKPTTCSTCGKMSLELERCIACDFWVCPECRIEYVCRECTDGDDDYWEEEEEQYD